MPRFFENFRKRILAKMENITEKIKKSEYINK